MNSQNAKIIVALAMAALLYGCGGGSSGSSATTQNRETGTVSISLTDGPREDTAELVLHITGIEMGHSDGAVVNVGMVGGPMEVDMMQLQNGLSTQLADGVEVPMGQYEWMRLRIDPAASHVGLANTGGNWVYLFPGDVTEPDDIAEPEMDGMAGPMAVDRIELDTMTSDHRHHFGYRAPGRYRIAMTCSGEWDDDGDDDHPSDPDGKFGFRMFSDPIEEMAGRMHDIDLMP